MGGSVGRKSRTVYPFSNAGSGQLLGGPPEVSYSRSRSLVCLSQSASANPSSFYEWRDTRRTKISLGILTLISFTIILSPLRLLVKSFQLAAGLVFFVFAPIWNRYPQYRLLASPLKWIFWKIPTHGMCRQCRVPDDVPVLTREW